MTRCYNLSLVNTLSIASHELLKNTFDEVRFSISTPHKRSVDVIREASEAIFDQLRVTRFQLLVLVPPVLVALYVENPVKIMICHIN